MNGLYADFVIIKIMKDTQFGYIGDRNLPIRINRILTYKFISSYIDVAVSE